MCNYVIVDLEMCNVTSSDIKEECHLKNEIIQIGAVLLNEKLEIYDTYMTYVKPKFGALDSVIIELTGISNDDLEEAPYFEEAIKDFLYWVPNNSKLVSWSENDELQVRREAAAKGIAMPKLMRLFDSWIDCQKTFGKVMYSSRNYNLVEALNISSIDYDSNVHDALVDAKNTALIFAKMEKEKDKGYKLSKYISIGKNENSGYTPFADLLAKFYA